MPIDVVYDQQIVKQAYKKSILPNQKKTRHVLTTDDNLPFKRQVKSFAMKANHNLKMNVRNEGKISNDLIEIKPGSILSKYNTEQSEQRITKAQINQETFEQTSIGMQ